MPTLVASEQFYPFDHAVINVRDQLDEGVRVFRRLGFRVTPRGFHTLGSINHLLVFNETYIELIGFSLDNAAIRPELRAAAPGLNGIVFRSCDADQTFREAQQRGAPVLEPQKFSRPVDLGDEALLPGEGSPVSGPMPDAVFRTVRTPPDFGPGGRVYFCEHLTPDLVWREAWRHHPNTAVEMSLIRVESKDPADMAQRFARLLGADKVRELGPARFEVSAAPLVIEISAGSADRMRLVRIRVVSLEQARAVFAKSGIPYREDHGTAGPVLHVAPAHAGGAEFEFCQR